MCVSHACTPETAPCTSLSFTPNTCLPFHRQRGHHVALCSFCKDPKEPLQTSKSRLKEINHHLSLAELQFFSLTTNAAVLFLFWDIHSSGHAQNRLEILLFISRMGNSFVLTASAITLAFTGCAITLIFAECATTMCNKEGSKPNRPLSLKMSTHDTVPSHRDVVG